MEGGFLLDVVVGQGITIFKLFPSKDKPLLIWGDALLVLDLGLQTFIGVRSLHLKGNSLPIQGLDKDLHPTRQADDQVKGGLLVDVVVKKAKAIFKLFPSEDKPLLMWGEALLVPDL